MQSGVPLRTVLPIVGKAVREVPDLVVDVMRGIYKKHISAVLDYHLKGDGRSDSLWVVSLRITNLCNHRCAICAQWGQHGYNFGRPNSQIVEHTSVEVYQKMVDDISHLRPHIYITGGEPFLYKDLASLVRYMKKKKLCVQIVTNGVLLEEYAEDIVTNGWDVLCVSIDGTREIHDKCRGSKGAYYTLFRGVEKVQELKSRSGSAKPYIITLTTVSRNNAGFLAESLEQAKQLRPDGMVVYYSWFTTEEIGQKHVDIMQRKLGVSPASWKGYVLDRGGLDLEVLIENIKEIKSRRFGCPILFVPGLKMGDIPKYYLEPHSLFGYKKCVAPWFMVDVMPDGSVVTCRDHPDYIVGNIHNDSLTSIYNNEKYRAFRRTLRSSEKGLFPICARCCGLMGY